jgi:uncharacterized protein YoxC
MGPYDEDINELRQTLNNVVEAIDTLSDEVARLESELERLKKVTNPEETGLWCETITWTDN